MHRISLLLWIAAIGLTSLHAGCSSSKTAQEQAAPKEEAASSDRKQNPPAVIDDSEMAPQADRSTRTGGGTASDAPVEVPRGAMVGGGDGTPRALLPSETPNAPPTGSTPSADGSTLPSESGVGAGMVTAGTINARSALRSEPGFEHVEVAQNTDGCYVLTGTVKTNEMKMQAGTLVRAATGAECVKNQIQVSK